MIELKSCDVPTEEQETTITFGRKDDRAQIYTNDPTVLTKISKVLNAEGSEWKLEEVYKNKSGVPSGYTFSCPKKMIKFSAKKKGISDERREALRERMLNLHGQQNNSEDDDDED